MFRLHIAPSQENAAQYPTHLMDVPNLDDPEAFFSGEAVSPPPNAQSSRPSRENAVEYPHSSHPSASRDPERSSSPSAPSLNDDDGANAPDAVNENPDTPGVSSPSAGQSVAHFLLACCVSPIAYFFPSTTINVSSLTSYAMLWPQLLTSPSALFYHVMSLSMVFSYNCLAASLTFLWMCIPESVRPDLDQLKSTVKTIAMVVAGLILLGIVWCMFLGLGFFTYWFIYYMMLPPHPITVPLHFDYSASAAHNYLMHTAPTRSNTADQDFSLLFTPSTHARAPVAPIASPVAHAAVGPRAFLPLAPMEASLLASVTSSPLAGAATCYRSTGVGKDSSDGSIDTASRKNTQSENEAFPADFDAAYISERTNHRASPSCGAPSLLSVASPHSRPPSAPLLATAHAYDVILHLTTPAHPYFHTLSRQYSANSLHEASVITAVATLFAKPQPLHPSVPPKSGLVPLTSSTWSFAPFAPAHSHATHIHDSRTSLSAQDLYSSPLAFIDDEVLACAARGCHVDDVPQASTFVRFFAWLMHAVVTSYPARMLQWSMATTSSFFSLLAAPYHLMQLIVKYCLSFFGATQELRTHAIPLFIGVPTSAAPVAAQVMLSGPHAFDLNVVDARVSLVARTSGVQWLMLYWPLTACIVGTCLCALAEAVVACIAGVYVYMYKQKQWAMEAEQLARSSLIADTTGVSGSGLRGDIPASPRRAEMSPHRVRPRGTGAPITRFANSNPSPSTLSAVEISYGAPRPAGSAQQRTETGVSNGSGLSNGREAPSPSRSVGAGVREVAREAESTMTRRVNRTQAAAVDVKVEEDVLSLSSLAAETPEQCRNRFWERLSALNPWSWGGIKQKVE